MNGWYIGCFFFQAEDGIRDLVRSRGLGDVYKRQTHFRTQLADMLEPHYGYRPDPRLLFPTAGVSQAMDVLCSIVSKPGDVALVEDPTYYCMPQLLQDRGLEVRAVCTDEHGMDPSDFQAQLDRARQEGRRVGLAYIIPVFNNPKAVSYTHLTLPTKRIV
eukprot:TRINITY_DN52384_c0_g1_i1.p1 TRINITY_DN52384_c0_g1~~TRINITY_DN52384_c0_g1_i1.p1  ORF type:complete len:160 (-),score=37.87 TRINITY_DN52384_c0_g1_i1:32-511(-)